MFTWDVRDLQYALNTQHQIDSDIVKNPSYRLDYRYIDYFGLVLFCSWRGVYIDITPFVTVILGSRSKVLVRCSFQGLGMASVVYLSMCT